MPAADTVIETDRLILRRHRLDDAAAVAALWADPEMVRHIGPPASEEESWGRLLRYAGHWDLFGYGLFAVEERATGRVIGGVGAGHFRRSGIDEPKNSAEAAWALSSAVHGRGYGREATEAMHRWVDAQVPVGRTHCIIAPENTASLRLARSLGYADLRTAEYRGDPVILLVRERPAGL